MFLLDTNIISELVKKQPDASVINKIETYRNALVIASPVWHELIFGCHRLPVSPKKEAIEFFLHTTIQKTLLILPYDEKSAAWHAIERSRLSSKGLTPAFVDGQIASIAFTNDCILVTRNIKDYQGFSGLLFENWFET